MAAAKKGKCLGRCGASSRHTTKLKQSIFFRDLWPSQNIIEMVIVYNIVSMHNIDIGGLSGFK
jgi:hypothetical protein